MHVDTSAAEAALRDYAESFEHGDVDRVVSFLHLPCVSISPAGVIVFQDAAAARAGLSAGIEQMHRSGYCRTEFVGLVCRVLSSDLVSFSGVAVRIGAEGHELNRVGFTYMLRSCDHCWKLVCSIIHDPPA